MRITVNPEVQSAAAFPVWAAGRYQLEVVDLDEQASAKGKAMLVVQLQPTGEVFDEQGNPISRPGRLFDRILVEPVQTKNGNTISFLRPFVEAAGLSWSDFDTEELRGKTVTAQVGVEEYNGTRRNGVTRYVKAG